MRRNALLERVAPAVVLAAALAGTWSVWHSASLRVATEEESRFLLQVEQIKATLIKRLERVEVLLRGAGGVLAASEEVHHKEWRAFVKGALQAGQFPEVRAVAFVRNVRPEELDDFIASQRSDVPTFELRPPGPRDEYRVIALIEPWAENRSALGYDNSTVTASREATDRARDTAAASVSGQFRLVQEKGPLPAVVVYLPCYESNVAPATVAERRRKCLGWVAAPLRLDALAAGLRPTNAAAIEFELFDDVRAEIGNLLHRAEGRAQSTALDHGAPGRQPAAFELHDEPIPFGGRTWVLRFHKPTRSAANWFSVPNVVTAAAAIIGVLIAWLVRSLATTQARAVALADEMTASLSKSERLARGTLDGLSSLIAIVDCNGAILAVNKAWMDFGEANPPVGAQIGAGANYLDICERAESECAPGAAEFAAGIREVLSRKRTGFEMEYACHAPRAQRWFIGRVTRFADDGPAMAVVAHENVTARKLSELALRDSEQRTLQILDAALDAVISMDEAGVIRYWNPQAAKVFGYRRDEVVCRRLADVIIPERRRDEHNAGLAKFLVGGPDNILNRRIETSVLRRDGTEFPCELTILPVRYGDRPSFTAFVRDITERVEAEEALRRSQVDLERRVAERTAELAHANEALVWEASLNQTVADLARTLVERHSLDEVSRVVLDRACALTSSRLGLLGVVHDSTLTVAAVHDAAADSRAATDCTPAQVAKALEQATSNRTYYVTNERARPTVAAAGVTPHEASDGAPPIDRVVTAPAVLEGLRVGQLVVANAVREYASRDLMVVDRLGSFFALALQRIHADEALAAARRDLERRVQERTIELEEANRTLHEEMAARNRLAEELRESKNFLVNIVENIPLAVFAKDVADGYRMTLWNKAASETFGLAVRDVVGRNADELWPADQAASYRRIDERVVSEKRIVDVPAEASHSRTRGEIWLRTRKMPLLDDAGEVTHVLCICDDITERRRAEQELKDYAAALEAANHALAEFSQAAQAASSAKSQFLANMSHEIRTPMTAILGYTDLLLYDERLDAAPDDRRAAMRVIQRNGEHLLGILNDILDLSKIEAGRLEIERVRCSPTRIVCEIASLMRVRALTKGLELGVEFIGPMPETIDSDPTRLRQILINLIGNAIKFTDAGGVRVLARCIVEDASAPMIEFQVIDTGIGMSREQIDRLFKPFVQADSSTTRRFGGTGLGLTISKRLTEILGGELSVESGDARGSTFRVRVAAGSLEGVPFVRSVFESVDTRPAPVSDAPVTAALDCRILLAEDGPDNQRLLSLVLRKAGADVEVVDNGQLAVRAALDAAEIGRPFDVVLMDMQMPVLDGYGATAELRQAGYLGTIVALTAHAMVGDREKCLSAGCDDYATKPIDRNKLLSQLRAHLDRRRAAEQRMQ